MVIRNPSFENEILLYSDSSALEKATFFFFFARRQSRKVVSIPTFSTFFLASGYSIQRCTSCPLLQRCKLQHAQLLNHS